MSERDKTIGTLFKIKELDVDISERRNPDFQTGSTFFTWDKMTGKLIVNIKLEGSVLDLNYAKNVMFGFDFVESEGGIILDSIDGTVVIDNAEAGRCSLIVPSHEFNYSGEVVVYVFVELKDGRTFDGGAFAVDFKESWLDKELPEMENFYVKRFEDLANEIRRRVEEIKAEMDKELKAVKQDITTAQSDINRIQQQIDDNDIVRQSELDSAGFGENNLIRNSSEPIIINPAGNLSNAFRILYTGFKPNTTYTFSFEHEWLRGGAPSIMFQLRTNDGTNWEGLWVRNIPVTGSSFTFTTPSSFSLDFLTLVVRGGSDINNNQGNTLQLSNPMLTHGTKSQPYRQADEDNTKRLDNIETLKPVIKRTVATFEGKVSGSVVENPHVFNTNSNTTVFVTPTQDIFEASQISVDAISAINDRNTQSTNSVQANAIVQHRFTFNIIEHLERNYSTAIWQGHTALADKVRIAKQIVKRIACVWDGRGETNGVPWVGVRWADSLNNWNNNPNTHTNSISQRITSVTEGSISFRILPDGTVRILVHTVENQTTPIGGASLTTAFVQFEVDVELTLAHTGWSYSKAETDKQLLRYLPLSGGELTGGLGFTGQRMHVRMNSANSSIIKINSQGGTWWQQQINDAGHGDERALVRGLASASYSSWHPLISMKASNGNNSGTWSQGIIQPGNDWTIAWYNQTRASNGTDASFVFGRDGRFTANSAVIDGAATIRGNITAPRLIGTADTATRLQTARNFRLTGAVEGTTSSNLNGDVVINTTQRWLQVTDWSTIDPLALKLRRGDSITIWGHSTAANQPLGTIGVAWVGELRCVINNGRHVAEVHTGYRTKATAEYRDGAWSGWDRVPVTGLTSTVFDMTVARATSLVNTVGQEINVFNELTECQNELTTCQNELQECKAEIAELKTMMLQIKGKSG